MISSARVPFRVAGRNEHPDLIAWVPRFGQQDACTAFWMRASRPGCAHCARKRKRVLESTFFVVLKAEEWFMPVSRGSRGRMPAESTRLRNTAPKNWIRVLVYGVWCRMAGFEYSFTERGDKQLDSSTRLLDGVRGNGIRVLVCPLASYPLVSPRSRSVEALGTCSGTQPQPQP